MIFNVLANRNHSVILWFPVCLFVPVKDILRSLLCSQSYSSKMSAQQDEPLPPLTAVIAVDEMRDQGLEQPEPLARVNFVILTDRAVIVLAK